MERQPETVTYASIKISCESCGRLLVTVQGALREFEALVAFESGACAKINVELGCVCGSTSYYRKELDEIEGQWAALRKQVDEQFKAWVDNPPPGVTIIRSSDPDGNDPD